MDDSLHPDSCTLLLVAPQQICNLLALHLQLSQGKQNKFVKTRNKLRCDRWYTREVISKVSNLSSRFRGCFVFSREEKMEEKKRWRRKTARSDEGFEDYHECVLVPHKLDSAYAQLALCFAAITKTQYPCQDENIGN